MKPKLLVAEDHPSMRAMVVRLLQRDSDVVASVAKERRLLKRQASSFHAGCNRSGCFDADSRWTGCSKASPGSGGAIGNWCSSVCLLSIKRMLALPREATRSIEAQMASDLVRAVNAVLAGKTFVSAAKY